MCYDNSATTLDSGIWIESIISKCTRINCLYEHELVTLYLGLGQILHGLAYLLLPRVLLY